MTGFVCDLTDVRFCGTLAASFGTRKVTFTIGDQWKK